MKKQIIFFVFLFAISLHRLVAQPIGWSSLGINSNALNANSSIFFVQPDVNGNIYATGNFTNTLGFRYVAKWNGTNWNELGTGSNTLNANAAITSLAINSIGNVYAAGIFTNTLGFEYVAKWNGTNWSELGTGNNALNANGFIYYIAVDSKNNLYATGDFTNAAGKHYVAKWNGTNWSELGTGNNALNANSWIIGLAIDSISNVYAVGNFSNNLGKSYVAKWNGTNWAELGTGNNALNPNNVIYSTAVDSIGNVYAAGNFTNAAGNYYVAKWNGTNWNELGTNNNALNANNTIYCIAIDTFGNVNVAGNFTNSLGKYYVAEWNGKYWSSLNYFNSSLNANNPIYTIAATKANVYASGDFTDSLKNSKGHRFVAKWSGNNNCLRSFDTLNINTCNYYVLNNITYNNSGTYNQLLINSKGCDSILTINLILSHSFSFISQKICANSKYFLGGNTYLEYDTLTNHLGCDSIIALTTTTFDSIYYHTVNTCTPYLFKTTWITKSGTYRDSLINHVGCDSVVYVYLTIDSIPIVKNLYAYCVPDSFLFNGSYHKISGIYTDTTINSKGCDSITILNLQIQPTISTPISKTICNNESFYFNGQFLTTTGNYSDTIISSKGCDSLVTLYLTVIPIDTIVRVHGNQLALSSAQLDSIQWINCTSGLPIKAANQQSFQPVTNGSYAAIVFFHNCKDTTNCYPIIFLGTSNLTNNNLPLSIYPNPTTNELTITNQTNIQAIEITDLIGRIFTVLTVNNSALIIVDVEHFPSGIYILKATTTNGFNHITKFVKVAK